MRRFMRISGDVAKGMAQEGPFWRAYQYMGPRQREPPGSKDFVVVVSPARSDILRIVLPGAFSRILARNIHITPLYLSYNGYIITT